MKLIAHSGASMTATEIPRRVLANRGSRASLGLRDRMLVGAALILPIVYGLIVNLNTLDNPPAWDSAITVSPAALTIVDRDFDILHVAQLPSALEGGPSIHATSIYTIGLATLISLFGPSSAFYIAHLVSILLLGAFSGSTYLLARERASVRLSALAAFTVSVVPLVIQQASDVYLDLPLAVVATLACWTASRRWFWRTSGLVFVAVAIKTAGVFLIPLLLVARPLGRPGSRHLLTTVGASLLCSLPFLIALVNSDRFEQGGQPWADPTLLVSSVLGLTLTTDVALLLVVYVIVTFLRARAGMNDQPSRVGAVALLGFFAVYGATVLLSGTIMILPRYYIAVLPVLVAGLLPGISDTCLVKRRLSVGFLIALSAFSIVNVRGDFYPVPNHDFPVIAERSTRAQEVLAMQIDGVRRLAGLEIPVIVDRQVFFELAYPDLGYVEETPPDMITTFEPPEELPDHFAMLIERRFQNPLVEVEDRALRSGYTLTYEEISYGHFNAQLVIAAR